MARKFKSGVCVHCCTYSEELTSDHVFPDSWYPNTSIDYQDKWQVPSCAKCNRELGRIEKDLMIRIGLCLDRNDPACKGIVEKALRSLDPNCGKNEKDARARKAKRNHILGQSMEATEIPQRSIYPNFGFYPDHPFNGQVGITIPASSVRKVGEKIIRGIFFIDENKVIDENYKIETFITIDSGAQPLMDAVSRFGVVYEKHPGILIKKATVEECLSSLFYIEIWKRFIIYGSITALETKI